MNLLPAKTGGVEMVGAWRTNSVNCVDAIELLRGLPTGSVNLIVVDWPYNGVKTNEWDNQWTSDKHYLEWMAVHLEQMRRVLKLNGSYYGFASPRMAARVEVLTSDYFNVLNNIRWVKEDGWHNKTKKEEIRKYLQPWEAIVFAEQYASDHKYVTLEYELNGTVYAPLKEWFRSRVNQYGITIQQVNMALGAATNGGGLASGYFGDKIEFQLPTLERYQKLQQIFPQAFNREYEDLRREYEDLRREYEDLRREYEDLRRPFNASPYAPYTDVWEFKTVQSYPDKHPCEKPMSLMRHIVKTSSRVNDIVLDCFCGSGATLDAASQLSRSYIAGDTSAEYCAIAERRLAQPYTIHMFEVA